DGIDIGADLSIDDVQRELRAGFEPDGERRRAGNVNWRRQPRGSDTQPGFDRAKRLVRQDGVKLFEAGERKPHHVCPGQRWKRTVGFATAQARRRETVKSTPRCRLSAGQLDHEVNGVQPIEEPRVERSAVDETEQVDRRRRDDAGGWGNLTKAGLDELDDGRL